MSSEPAFEMVFAGIGGQGVLLASEIAAAAAFKEGLDVKKSEVHGMAQRGGSVVSHVRMGKKVYSPLISRGGADILMAFEATEAPLYTELLKPNAKVIDSTWVERGALPHPRTANIFLLGCLAQVLPFSQAHWEEAIEKRVRANTLEFNIQAFRAGLAAKPPERMGENVES